jgi:hypothetical protein
MAQWHFVRLVVEVEPDLADRRAAWIQDRDATRKQVIIDALEEYFTRHRERPKTEE